MKKRKLGFWLRFIMWRYKKWLLGFILMSIVFICMVVISYEWSARVLVLDVSAVQTTVHNIGYGFRKSK